MDNRTLYQTLRTTGYRGFRLEKTHYIQELQCDMWQLFHKSSGMSLVYIDAPDREKCFGLSFAFSPSDDTGVAHIIEHTLLCGSRKYPSKAWGGDGLLCSFYSAFTMRGSYFCPVASTDEKSFQELVRLYTDMIFDPLLVEDDRSMLQEGWHYEYDAATDKLTCSGIVYSEMRAAYEMPDYILADAQLRAACPNTSLAWNVGGAPSCIPQLTREQFVETYYEIFRTENCLGYVYGDTCLSAVIDVLEPYLRRPHKKGDKLSVVGEPAVFTGNAHIESYPLAASDAGKKKKDIISLNWILPQDRETVIKAAVLAELLASRFSALQPAPRLSVSCMQEYYWPMLSVVLRDSDRDQLSAVHEEIFRLLRQIRKEPFSAEEIETACSSCQFAFADKAYFVPQGVNHGIKVTEAWAHDRDPWELLEYEDCLEQISDAKDPEAFSGLIDTLLLNNPFYSQLVLAADPDLSEKRKAQEEERLSALRAQLTEEELKKITDTMERLRRYQSEPDDPAVLAALPRTKIADLDRTAPVRFPRPEETCSGTILFAETSSSIIDSAVYFDIGQLSVDELHMMGLLRLLFGKFSCGGKSVDRVSRYAKLFTGGIELTAEPFYSGSVDSLKAVLRFKTFQKHFLDAESLAKAMLYQADYENADQVKAVLSQALESYTVEQIDLISRARACYSSAHAALQHINGYAFYQYLRLALADFEKQYPLMIEGLDHLLSHQLNPAKAMIAISCRKGILEELESALTFPSSFHDSRCTFPLCDRSIAYKNAGVMQYLAYAGKTPEVTGALLASAKLAKTLATNAIRNIGGAYTVAAEAAFSGEILMRTGRDPHLGQTIRAFQSLPAQMRTAGDSMISTAIISAASDFGEIQKAGTAGFLAYSEFELAMMNYFCGVDPEMQQQLWDMLLAAAPQEIRACADIWEDVLLHRAYCASASADKLKKDGHLFGEIAELQ